MMSNLASISAIGVKGRWWARDLRRASEYNLGFIKQLTDPSGIEENV